MIELDVDQDALNSHERLDEQLFVSAARLVSDRTGANGTIALRFVSDKEIQRLNRHYRNKDSVTDVLSFSYAQDPGELLGDIAISFEQARRQAVGDVQAEVVMLIVHGMLHVLGYDHEEPHDAQLMFPLQDSIVDNLLV